MEILIRVEGLIASKDWPVRVEAVRLKWAHRVLEVKAYALEEHTGLLVSRWSGLFFDRAERHQLFTLLKAHRIR